MAVYVDPDTGGTVYDEGENSPGGGSTGETPPSTGCGPGMVPESIGSDGNWRTAAPGECIDQGEFNRRVDLNVKNNPGSGGNNPNPGAGGGGPQAPQGPAKFPFTPVPEFDAPDFKWDEAYALPSLEDARKEPGYEFANSEGLRALEQSAAARGVLRTGGHPKSLYEWANKFGEQNYGNVADRYHRGYETRFNTAKDKFSFDYQGKKDEYAPKLFEWQTKTAFGTQAASDAWKMAWQKYFDDTLGADEIFRAGQD